MNNNFDYKAYWITRHQKYRGDLRSVGIKSYRESANTYKYRLVAEQYENALSELTLSLKAHVLDVGAGTGEFISLFLKDRRVSRIIATDVSATALEQLNRKYPSVQILTESITDLKFSDQSIELVHCFDVLYHIIDDAEWKRSIENLCRISAKYITIHGEVLYKPRYISSHHVKSRLFSLLDATMQENGFKKKYIIPTHLLSHRFLFYKINGLFPKIFYHIDNFCIEKFPSIAQRIASYGIIIYERIEQ